MKYLPHIFLPPILVGLCLAFIYLPKYFQFGAALGDPAADLGGKAVESDQASPENFEVMIQPFITKLESRDLIGAELELEKIGSKIPVELKTGLQVSLLTAKEYQEELIEATALSAKRQSRLEASLRKAEKQLADLQTGGLEQINASLVELIEKAKSAEDRTENYGSEITKLRQIIIKHPLEDPNIQIEGNPPLVELPKSLDALKIPAPLTVHFKDDSTVIPDSVSMYVDQMGEWLKGDDRLGIRLRARLQSGFSPGQNETLAKTRISKVKESLIKNGAAEEQIEMEPLDSQTAPSSLEAKAAAFGYVELIFIERTILFP